MALMLLVKILFRMFLYTSHVSYAGLLHLICKPPLPFEPWSSLLLLLIRVVEAMSSEQRSTSVAASAATRTFIVKEKTNFGHHFSLPITLKINNSTTSDHIKAMIGDIVGIPPDQQVLTHVVKDGCELWNTHIQDGDTLYVEKKESQFEETRRQVQQIRAAAHADTGKQVLKHFL